MPRLRAEQRRVLRVRRELGDEPPGGDVGQRRAAPDHREGTHKVKGEGLSRVNKRLTGRAALVRHVLEHAGRGLKAVRRDAAGAIAISWHPRRAASWARASTSTVCPEVEVATTRSAAPTQPGST